MTTMEEIETLVATIKILSMSLKKKDQIAARKQLLLLKPLIQSLRKELLENSKVPRRKPKLVRQVGESK
jgi:hypothetical protein